MPRASLFRSCLPVMVGRQTTAIGSTSHRPSQASLGFQDQKPSEEPPSRNRQSKLSVYRVLSGSTRIRGYPNAEGKDLGPLRARHPLLALAMTAGPTRSASRDENGGHIPVCRTKLGLSSFQVAILGAKGFRRRSQPETGHQEQRPAPKSCLWLPRSVDCRGVVSGDTE